MPQTMEQRLEQLARGRETSARNRAAAAQANPEATAILEENLADANQQAGLGLSRDTISEAAGTVAALYDAERDEVTGGDVTALAAQALAASSARHDEPIDRPTLQSELQSVGAPVVRPDGILSREEERARDEKNRAEIAIMMAAPSSKRLRQLQALRDSPPWEFYCPIDIPDGMMNGVPIIIYEGMIKRKTPGTLELGCMLVATWVDQLVRTRGWALTDSRSRRMQEILDPEVDDARHTTATRPAAGIY